MNEPKPEHVWGNIEDLAQNRHLLTETHFYTVTGSRGHVATLWSTVIPKFRNTNIKLVTNINWIRVKDRPYQGSVFPPEHPIECDRSYPVWNNYFWALKFYLQIK